MDGGVWQKDNIWPHKHTIAAYGAAIASLHILLMAVGKKSTMPFCQGSHGATI